MFRDEFESLFRFDVPYFSVCAGDSDLTLNGGERLEGFFVRSGFDAAIEKIESLSRSDLQLQEALIRAAFVLKERTELHVADREARAPEFLGTAPRLSTAAYLEVAEEIALEIEARAIRANDGSSTWICANLMTQAPQVLPQADRRDAIWRQRRHCAVLRGHPCVWRRCPLARAGLLGAFHAAQASSGQRGSQALGRVNLGAGVGLGSIIYGFAAAGDWLNDPQLLDEAALVAEELTAQRIATDGAFDVVYGCAGAILGLCRLHATSPDARVRDAARRCGDHLLACRSDAGGGRRSWATPDQVHFSGFSHGAAGIAYALCRLYELVPEPAYRTAAEEAIAFERGLA